MEPTKRCTKCSEQKPIVEFYKNPSRPLGVRSSCKLCDRKVIDKFRNTSRGAKARRKAVRRYSKTDKCKAQQRGWRARRDKFQRLATPPWAPTHMLAAVYAEAERLTLESGIKHEVHHIMPIMEFGALFVGLHVPWNLEILSVEEHSQAHVELRAAYSRAAQAAKKMTLKS